MFGLTDNDVETIKGILAKYNEVISAFIYGSRAKGNYKTGSDVDIALKGIKLTRAIILNISESLNEETLMPYHFDVCDYYSLHNADLIQHIDRVGIEFYKKSQVSPVED